MADRDDDLFETVSSMAERLGLSGKERRTYIHEHMTRSGYRMEPTYVPAEEGDDDDSGGGFFGSSGRSRSRRNNDDDDDRDRGSRRTSGSTSRRRPASWYDD